jgi:hypothetical protein
MKLLSLYNATSVANGKLFCTSVTTAPECSVTKMKFDIHTFSGKSLECKARYGEKFFVSQAKCTLIFVRQQPNLLHVKHIGVECEG